MRTLFKAIGCLALGLVAIDAASAAQKPATIELGVQAWTFRRFTLAETLDKARALGITNIEIFPGQTLGGGLDGVLRHDMTPEARATVLDWAKLRGLTLVSYGVVGAKDEAEWRKIFDFAKAMKLRTVVSEPPQESLELVAKLAKAARVRVALHNHPTPSRYADPKVAIAAAKEAGAVVGLCADTGHWLRSGHDPVESLRAAAGLLVELHFKDLSEAEKKGHDVPWGTGVSHAAGQIAELRRQGFSGVVFAEYERETLDLETELARCVGFFRQALATSEEALRRGRIVPPGYTDEPPSLWRRMGKSHAPSATWPAAVPLFAADLSDAEFAPGSWAWEDGVLVARGGGDIWTKAPYGDFALSLEFRCEAGSNSGVFLRASDIVEWLHNAIEVQILQGDAENPRHVVGSLFDVQEPTRQLPIEPGTWHKFVITAKGSAIDVLLDGEQIVKADLDKWTTAGQNPDGSPNKFAKAYRDMARQGRIGLQYHGHPIAFRNLLIEPL